MKIPQRIQMNNSIYLHNSIHGVLMMLLVDQSIWHIFLICFLSMVIILCFFLINHSKNPEDLKHKTILHEKIETGRVYDLTESIKVTPISYNKDTALKQLIQREFFEKVKLRYGLSNEEMKNLVNNRKNDFIRLIDDKDIANFVFNNYKEKKFDQKNITKKDRFVLNLKIIVDKMVRWNG